jgi:phosphate transport system substrate-binding protein
VIPRLALALSIVTIAACSGSERSASDTTAAASSGSVDLNGAGATFPYPIYSKWFSDYAAQTGVKINHQSIGSRGIRQPQRVY